MRKSHFACLLLGVVAGVALGFGLVIAQLKYGRPPVAAVDPCDDGVCQSDVKEPTPVGDEISDEDEKTDGKTDAPPTTDEHGIVLGAPIQVPFGPVEVMKVHRPGGDVAVSPSHDNPLEGGVEEVERRMFNHLVRHMQAGGCEASEATAELLPMPSEDRAAVTDEGPSPSDPIGELPVPEQHYMPAYKTHPAPQMATPKPVVGKKQRLPYIGRYDAAIDCENHLTLPADVHEMLGSPRPRALYLLPGSECLSLYTETGFRKLLDKTLPVGALDTVGRDERICFSKLRRIEVRADGDLVLPADLVEQAGLEAMPVVIIGVGDHIEIWDRCRWDEYSGVVSQASFNDLTEIFTSVVGHVLGNLPLPLEICVSWDDANGRMKELLNTSDQSDTEEDQERIWWESEPSHLTPEKIHGGIQ